jgi:hypothetical protein
MASEAEIELALEQHRQQHVERIKEIEATGYNARVKIEADKQVKIEEFASDRRKHATMKGDTRATVLGILFACMGLVSVVTVVAAANVASEFNKTEQVKACMVQPGYVWVANEDDQMECRKP